MYDEWTLVSINALLFQMNCFFATPIFVAINYILIESTSDISSSTSIISIFRFFRWDLYRSLIRPNITGGDIGIFRLCAHTWEPIFRFCIDARCRGTINSRLTALLHAHAQECICSELSVCAQIPVCICLICTELQVSCPSADAMVIVSVVSTDAHQEHSCLILVKAPNWYAFVFRYEIDCRCTHTCW